MERRKIAFACFFLFLGGLTFAQEANINEVQLNKTDKKMVTTHNYKVTIKNSYSTFEYYSESWSVRVKYVPLEVIEYRLIARNSVEWNVQEKRFERCGYSSANYSCGKTWTNTMDITATVVDLKNKKTVWQYPEASN